MKRISLRAQLRKLWHDHPDWTYAQFAEALGQSKDSIRGAIQAMKLKRPSKVQPKKKVQLIQLPQKPMPNKKGMVAGSARITSSINTGYVRLL